MYARNVKSERILTKLLVLDYEYICNSYSKFSKVTQKHMCPL